MAVPKNVKNRVPYSIPWFQNVSKRSIVKFGVINTQFILWRAPKKIRYFYGYVHFRAGTPYVHKLSRCLSVLHNPIEVSSIHPMFHLYFWTSRNGTPYGYRSKPWCLSVRVKLAGIYEFEHPPNMV